MRVGTLLRLATTGSGEDGLRIGVTAIGATLGTLAMLAAATVLAITGGGYEDPSPPKYTNLLLVEEGLRPGVAFALLMLCLPVLFFAGQGTRIGAPHRDRRLAAIRLVGGTPRDVALIAAAETGVAAAAGALFGAAVYLAGRLLLDAPDPSGFRTLPTDVLPATWVLAAVLVSIPLVASLFTALALRRVIVTPLGVTRRRRVRPPSVLPAVLLLGGFAGLAFSGPVLRLAPKLMPVIDLSATVVTGIGLLLGMASLSSVLGRVLAGRARRPALVIAARRLHADPWGASRSLAAIVMTVLIGAMIAGVRTAMITGMELEDRVNASNHEPPDPFYARAFELLDLAVWTAAVIAAAGLLVATVEQLTARRRMFASLTAAGTPRGVLARATLIEVALPLVIGVFVSVVAGTVAMRSVTGPSVSATAPYGPGEVPVSVTETIGVPWLELTLFGAGTVAVALALTAAGLTLLRRATDVRELRAG